MNPSQKEFSVSHLQNGQQLVLHPEKAIFWKEENMLILSDLHLGKAEHFRRSGIPVPEAVHFHDLARLSSLIKGSGAKKIVFLGDLFHSDLNSGWWHFNKWMEEFPQEEFFLVKGNHDILPPQLYIESRLNVFETEMLVYPFLLTHEPLGEKEIKEGYYNISGHIHPAVLLKGRGLQQITLACFYFGLHYALLPAFGKFTGFYKIQPKKEDAVFAIAEKQVLRL